MHQKLICIPCHFYFQSVTVSSSHRSLHALPNGSAAIFESNGIKAFGISRSVVQNNLSHGPWETVPIHYKVRSTWTQSHLVFVLSRALLWLSRDGSWGTEGAQEIYLKKLLICYQVSHIWYSCFLATAPLSHLLKHHKEIFLVLMFLMPVNAEKFIKAKHMEKFWMATTTCF